MRAPSVRGQELSDLGSETPRLKSSATRAELLRALAAVVLSPPSSCRRALEALGLSEVTGAEHTAVFVLAAPPHAAIYLGKEGKLGGEGLDRVAGYWRAIGLEPPTEADHLGLLLALYCELLDAQAAARSELSPRPPDARSRDAVDRACLGVGARLSRRGRAPRRCRVVRLGAADAERLAPRGANCFDTLAGTCLAVGTWAAWYRGGPRRTARCPRDPGALGPPRHQQRPS